LQVFYGKTPLAVNEWTMTPERHKIFDLMPVYANTYALIGKIKQPKVDFGLFVRQEY